MKNKNFDIEQLIIEFISNDNIKFKEIDNEYSLQFELAYFLRTRLEKCIVTVEKKVTIQKLSHRLDIYIKTEDNKEYAIELKFPTNGQVPIQMYKFIKDIETMEELKNQYNYDNTFALLLTNDKKILTKNNSQLSTKGIYKYFRTDTSLDTKIEPISIPVGKDKDNDNINLRNRYSIEFQKLNNENSNFAYCLIKC